MTSATFQPGDQVVNKAGKIYRVVSRQPAETFEGVQIQVRPAEKGGNREYGPFRTLKTVNFARLAEPVACPTTYASRMCMGIDA